MSQIFESLRMRMRVLTTKLRVEIENEMRVFLETLDLSLLITKSVMKWSELNSSLVGILKNHWWASSGQWVTKPYFYMPHGPVYMLTFDCSTTIYYYYYKPQISGGKTTFHSTAGWRGHAPGVQNGPFISCVCCCPLPYFFHAVFTRHETFLTFLKRPICD